jgi:L-amino acid N-acyltransferase YncA
MVDSAIIARRATYSDLVQVSEIYNYYILHTSKALFEAPLSVCDLGNIFRRILDAGYPMLVLVYEHAQHTVLGFCFTSPDNVRLLSSPTLGTTVMFLKEDAMLQRLFLKGLLPLSKDLLEHGAFGGYIGFVNCSNQISYHKIKSTTTLLGFNCGVILKNGGYKSRQYHDIAVEFYSVKHVKELVRLIEHL